MIILPPLLGTPFGTSSTLPHHQRWPHGGRAARGAACGRPARDCSGGGDRDLATGVSAALEQPADACRYARGRRCENTHVTTVCEGSESLKSEFTSAALSSRAPWMALGAGGTLSRVAPKQLGDASSQGKTRLVIVLWGRMRHFIALRSSGIATPSLCNQTVRDREVHAMARRAMRFTACGNTPKALHPKYSARATESRATKRTPAPDRRLRQCPLVIRPMPAPAEVAELASAASRLFVIMAKHPPR